MFSKTTKFENLLKAVPDSWVGMDQKGMIRFVNRQTESLFEYDRHDLIGEPIETVTDVLCNASVNRDVNGVVLGVLATGRESANATNNLRSPSA